MFSTSYASTLTTASLQSASPRICSRRGCSRAVAPSSHLIGCETCLEKERAYRARRRGDPRPPGTASSSITTSPVFVFSPSSPIASVAPVAPGAPASRTPTSSSTLIAGSATSAAVPVSRFVSSPALFSPGATHTSVQDPPPTYDRAVQPSPRPSPHASPPSTSTTLYRLLDDLSLATGWHATLQTLGMSETNLPYIGCLADDRRNAFIATLVPTMSVVDRMLLGEAIRQLATPNV
ncbi:hypothetical protein C8J57DRAFT_1226038 [Mycena rebaudengoi]|nr:hypothetical protein C8J57DRAFT_1226038 [Mycena rebaudengoi]